jgi:hypothetical protein
MSFKNYITTFLFRNPFNYTTKCEIIVFSSTDRTCTSFHNTLITRRFKCSRTTQPCTQTQGCWSLRSRRYRYECVRYSVLKLYVYYLLPITNAQLRLYFTRPNHSEYTMVIVRANYPGLKSSSSSGLVYPCKSILGCSIDLFPLASFAYAYATVKKKKKIFTVSKRLMAVDIIRPCLYVVLSPDQVLGFCVRFTMRFPGTWSITDPGDMRQYAYHTVINVVFLYTNDLEICESHITIRRCAKNHSSQTMFVRLFKLTANGIEYR